MNTAATRDKLAAWAEDKPPQTQHAVKIACITMYLIEQEDDPALRVTLARTMEFVRESVGQ